MAVRQGGTSIWDVAEADWGSENDVFWSATVTRADLDWDGLFSDFITYDIPQADRVNVADDLFTIDAAVSRVRIGRLTNFGRLNLDNSLPPGEGGEVDDYLHLIAQGMSPGANAVFDSGLTIDGASSFRLDRASLSFINFLGNTLPSTGTVRYALVRLNTDGGRVNLSTLTLDSVATITGTTTVGETLTVNTAVIGDPDGLGAFSYQWRRADSSSGSNEAVISGATGSTYTLVDADAFKYIRARVSYTDGEGNAETVYTPWSDQVSAGAGTAATGEPSITGTLRVHEALQAGPGDIADADGLTNPGYTYQWRRADDASGLNAANIPGATGFGYTLVLADNGKHIQVRASFTDDLGNAEVRDSAWSAAVAPSVTGVPTITGTTTVGEVLTAVTDDIGDPDGFGLGGFNYRWWRRQTGSGAEIIPGIGSASSTYTLADADANHEISVVVSFIDGAGHSESVRSEWTSAVRAAVADGTSIWDVAQEDWGSLSDVFWQVESTKGDLDQWSSGGIIGYGSTTVAGPFISSDITASSHNYFVRQFTLQFVSGTPRWAIRTRREGDFSLADTPSQDDLADAAEDYVYGVIEHVESGNVFTFALSDDLGGGEDANPYFASDADANALTTALIAAPSTDTIRFALVRPDTDGGRVYLPALTVGIPANTDPTGEPSITGTLRVDETLTAVTDDIDDPDGLGAFSYQWRRADSSSGSNEAVISGATGSTYTLVDADADKYIRVRVSYTDGFGTLEHVLMSTWQGPVSESVGTPATGTPTIEGTLNVGQALSANTDDIADEDGLGEFEYQWRRADSSSGLNAANIPGATSGTYTLGDADEDKHVQVRVTFTDQDHHEEGPLDSAWSAAVGERINNPATGTPTITGTTTVGEVLTAVTDDIDDVDGLGAFSYQWQRADDASGTGAANIQFTPTLTARTYRLVQADRRKHLRVRVTFTDDQGFSEGPLDSAWSAEIAAGPNNPPTGEVVVEGTLTVGQSLTANTDDVDDLDGLGAFSYQWRRADDASGTGAANISGATGSTYTMVQADNNKNIQVRVTYTDGEGNDETISSAWTAQVGAPPNTAATGRPLVTGVRRVGEELGIDLDPVSDPDGTSSPGFTYQWLRLGIGEANATEIEGETGSTYTVVFDDWRHYIGVRVNFRDDYGYEESVRSVWAWIVGLEEGLARSDAPTEVKTALQADVVRPVFAVFVDLDSGPLRVWNGYGDLEADGETWTGAGELLGISAMEETSALEARGVQLSLSGLPTDVAEMVFGEEYQGRTAHVYMGVLDEDGSLIDDLVRVFVGDMDVATVTDNGTSIVISVAVESALIALERPLDVHYTSQHQQRLHPGDTFFDYVPALQDADFTVKVN